MNDADFVRLRDQMVERQVHKRGVSSPSCWPRCAPWMTHFFPNEDWARIQQPRCLAMLERMWMPHGYFCREPDQRDVKFAFTNFGVSIGLQAAGAMPERVARLNEFFDTWRSGDEYDREAITHVMGCSSRFPGYLVRGFG